MQLAIKFHNCRYCGRPHERDGEDFVPAMFCDVCSEERRSIAAGVFGSHPISAREIGELGSYLLPLRRS